MIRSAAMSEQAHESAPLLAAEISVSYPGKPRALDRVAFTVEAGETVGLIGQSGSGKSTLALAILRLLGRGAAVEGVLRFDGRDLLTLTEREMRGVRGRGIGLVLQSPSASMNPSLRLESHLAEAWRAHGETPWKTEKPRVRELLGTLGLPADDAFLSRYPHQVSVGQAQRVMIAAAILHRPRLLIADEPTSALDAFSAAEVLALLHRLSTGMGMAVLFISHDLRSVAALCRRALILEHGRVVEAGRTEEIFHRPVHPAARRLVDAMAALDRGFQLSAFAAAVDREGGEELSRKDRVVSSAEQAG
ncbi:MAG: ABC transporter ATP-binding protein [Bryobacteraceae bacterium]